MQNGVIFIRKTLSLSSTKSWRHQVYKRVHEELEMLYATTYAAVFFFVLFSLTNAVFIVLSVSDVLTVGNLSFKQGHKVVLIFDPFRTKKRQGHIEVVA